MAGLRDLEELLDREFGALDTEAEFAAEGGVDRAARIAASVPEISAGGLGDPTGELLDYQPPSFAPAEAEEYGFSTPRMLGAGILDVAEMATGIPEYLARQNEFTRDSGLPEFLKDFRASIGETREELLAGVDPDVLDRAGREVLTLDPERSVWRGNPLEVGGAIWDKFARSLPATLAVMLPAARLFRVGSNAGALTYLGASEGGLSTGAIANNITDEIAAMSHEDLLNESERYADLFRTTGDEEATRRAFTAEAQSAAPLVGGATVAAISLATGRILKPVFAGTKLDSTRALPVGQRVGRGFGSEALQEGAQGASEQVTQNFAAQIYDANRSIAEGVAEAAAQEGLIGGLTGGAVAGAFGTRPEAAPPPPPAPEEGEGGQLGLPGIGPAQPAPPDEPPPTPPVGFAPGVIYNEQQQEFWPDPGTTEGVIVPQDEGGPPGGQGVLPLGDTRPLRERGPGTRTITEVDEPLPTELTPLEDVPPAEDIDLATEDPARVSEATRDLFEGPTATPLTAGENVSTTEGFTVRAADTDGNVITEEQFATEEEADARSEELFGELPAASITIKPTRVAAAADKPGLTTATRANQPRILKGPPEGPPQGIVEPVPEEEAREAELAAAIEQQAAEEEERARNEFEDTVRQAEFDENITDEQLESLVRRESTPARVKGPEAFEDVDENQTTYFNTRNITREFDTLEEAEAFAAKLEGRNRALAISYGSKVPDAPQVTKPVEKMQGTKELDVVFERAVRAKGDRKATTAPSGEIDFEREAGDVTFKEGKGDLRIKRGRFKGMTVAQKAKQLAKERKEGRKVSPVATEKGSNLFDPDTQEMYELSTTQTTIEKESRERYGSTPGKKLKFIRRERGAQIRRKSEIRDIEDTKVVTKAKKGKVDPVKEVGTKSLVTESIRAEESVASKAKRLAKNKEARTRLQLARTRAKRFMSRFDTRGPFGTYLTDMTNIDGTLTQEARDFLSARAAFEQLLELADVVFSVKHKSNAHSTLMKDIAIALERVKLKSMSPEQFAKEFSAIAESTEYSFNKTVPSGHRESMGAKIEKIRTLNKRRANAIKRQAQFTALRNEPLYRDIVLPILNKIYDAARTNVARGDTAASEAVYTPNEFEMGQLRFALVNLKMDQRYNQDILYKPLRDEMTRLGFTFDSEGKLNVDGYEVVTSEAEATSKVQTPAGIFEPVAKVQDSQKVRESMDVADRYQAVKDILTANALLERFKSLTASSKVTINGIKRQEERFIRGLRKIGAWQDVSPGIGRIHLGGWKSKTYRLVGPRLDARTMKKDAAKNHVQRIARIPVPQELRAVQRQAERAGSFGSTIEEFVDENTVEFFLDSAKPYEYDTEYMDAATAIGDILEAKKIMSAPEALVEILKHAPVDSFYYQLADKLSQLDLGKVDIAYGRPQDFNKGNAAKYKPHQNIVLLNRDAFNDYKLQGDRVFSGRVMHAITHEVLHGATHNAIRENKDLANYFNSLRARVREHMQQLGETRDVYGLREGTPIDEFVVEAFSNPEFQQILKSVPAEQTSVWKKIIDSLKEILGLTKAADTVFEAILLTEDILFEGAGIGGARDSGEFWMQAYDEPLRKMASSFSEKFLQSHDLLNKAREKVREKGGALHQLMSMEQFVEKYSGKIFKDGVDLMAKYYDAFRKRNAKAAEYLQVPQHISLRWSKLEAKNPEDALRISQVGSEASLLTIDPRVPLEHESNEHLGDALKDDHARLHAEYNKMSPEAKKIMDDVIQYYEDSLETETLFLMQSSLRGVLATGEGAALSEQAFENEFSIENLRKLEDREQFTELLGKYIGLVEDDAPAEQISKAKLELTDTVDTIYRMSMLPRKRNGIYMPAMRYGDEVTFAERQRADKIFEDRKEAMAERKSLADDDPTLDVQVFENEDGGYTLRVFERAFIMGETVAEVEAEKARMIANSDFTEADFNPIQKKMDKQLDASISSNQALDSILKTLAGNKAAQAAIKNFYLRNLSENSFRKHEVKRKNRLGVRYDLQHRNLATYAKQASYYTSQLEFGWKMSKALSDMNRSVMRYRSPGVELAEGDVRMMSKAVDHLTKRDTLSHDLPDRGTFVKKSVEATHFFMLASPSYWAINATQPWMVTLPTLAGKHGMWQSAAAMKAVQKEIYGTLAEEAVALKGGLSALGKKNRARVEESFNIIDQIEEKLSSQDEKDLLEYLRKNHIIDINVFTEMRDIAAGRKQNTWDRMIDASRVMAHLTEVNNRAVTALAAYRLEINNGSTKEDAIEYAAKMVSQTQFNYSSENKPPIFQKYPLLFQFMQWPQHMYAHLIRNFVAMHKAGYMTQSEARSTVLGLLGTHAAVGGLTGMMLQPIKFAFGLAMMALGDEDEPHTLKNALSGATFDRTVARVSSDLFGTTVGSVVSRGAPMALGVDLSGRMSMGTLYFVDLRGDNAESVLGSLVASFGGASLNQGLKFANGVGKIMDGNVYTGVETMMPKVARDAMRAGRFYNEGLVNNAGDTAIPAADMNTWNVMTQAFGFQPGRVSQFYAGQSAIKDAERYSVGRKDTLMREYRDATTAAERAQVRAEIAEFNRGKPPGLRITYSGLMRNRQAQREREAAFRRYGANIDERKAKYFERYGSPYRDEE